MNAPTTSHYPTAPTAQKAGALGSDAGREPRSGDPGSNGLKLEEVVISGTHIDGADPASMVISADRESIQRSGSQSMGEFMQKQPQNFAGGSNANVIGTVLNRVKYKQSGSYHRGKSAYSSYYASTRVPSSGGDSNIATLTKQ